MSDKYKHYSIVLQMADGKKHRIPFAVPIGKKGKDGQDGISIYHSWNGTVLTITSASGTSSANLKHDLTDVEKQEIATQTSKLVTKSSLGLGNVDNTSDGNKPVSTAQKTAIETAQKNSNAYTDKEISSHNVSETSHNDIRLLIEGLVNRLNALADSDDSTLDQMSEVVAYIKANKDLIESITTSKVSVVDIVNNLTTSVTNKPLSASQGVVLKGLIDALSKDKLNATDLASAINTALAQAKASGDFNGKDGEDGEDGTDGKTPVKYVDYFTQSDIQEVARATAPLVKIDTSDFVNKTSTDEQVLKGSMSVKNYIEVTDSEDGTSPYKALLRYNAIVWTDDDYASEYELLFPMEFGNTLATQEWTKEWFELEEAPKLQPKLVNGTNFKKINGKSLLGSGSITLSASDVGAVPSGRVINGKSLTSNITLTAEDVGAVSKDAWLDLIYPVGSIYISSNPESPASLFGGDWTMIMAGTFLMAGANEESVSHGTWISTTVYNKGATVAYKNTSDNKTHYYLALQSSFSGQNPQTATEYWLDVTSGIATGGSADAVVVSHSHTFPTRANATNGSYTAIPPMTANSTNSTANRSVTTVGENGTGKNIPPYLAVNIWERVA